MYRFIFTFAKRTHFKNQSKHSLLQSNTLERAGRLRKNESKK